LWLGLWIAIASVGVGQAVPRSVEAIPRSVERITLYWLPPRGETPSAYRVFLDGAQVAEVDGAAKSYDFTGLRQGVSIGWRCRRSTLMGVCRSVWSA